MENSMEVFVIVCGHLFHFETNISVDKNGIR